MGLIYRSEANCKNCYKCVRTCSSKAVRFAGGQAEVMEEFCLHCGECVLACPQRAKRFVTVDVERFRAWLGRERIVVSMAPSAVGFFENLPLVIERLMEKGVQEVRETAEGAAVVSKTYQAWWKEHPGKAWISANCPVVVNWIEKHHPALIPYLVPIVSPMIAHGRLIKKAYGNGVKVVMVSPCPAKLGEAREPRAMGAIDASITFTELAELLELHEVDQPMPAIASAEKKLPRDERISRLYPLPGGMLPAAGETMDWNHLIMHGLEDLELLTEALNRGELQSGIIEALGCRQGCLGGFAFRQRGKGVSRTQQFISLVSSWPETDWQDLRIDLKKTYINRQPDRVPPTEAQLREVLREIGKTRPEDELNCGACGYTSCREKATAVFYGQAEVGMCMPYMESRAESLSNKIIEATPNAIILVDGDMVIREFNPSAEELFVRKRGAVIDQPLDLIFAPDDFRIVAETHEPIVGKKVAYPKYGRFTRQTIVWVEDQNLVLGLLTDITREEQQTMEMTQVKEETLTKAQEVIDKQMRTVQEIAGLLGETAAESKILLSQLMGLVSREGRGGS